MKLITFIFLILTLPAVCQIDDSAKDLAKKSTTVELGWTKGGMTTLNINQLSLTNWAAGGNSSVALASRVNLFANYKKDSLTWDNNVDLGFGVINQADLGWSKNDDRINLSSKVGQQASKRWYYAGLLNFRSQFAKGYNDDDIITSNWLAPGYLVSAIGMDYKPSSSLSMFIAPATSKLTVVMDDELSAVGAYGVDTASVYRSELGGYIKLAFQKEVAKNVTMQAKLDAFSNYLKDPQNIDLNTEINVSMKVNEYLAANVGMHLIYDEDIDVPVDRSGDGVNDGVGPRTQMKQLFGAGFSYIF